MGLIAALLAALSSSISHAGDACPPYKPDPSLLENLESFLRDRPGAIPLTAEQKRQIQDLAREKSPARLGEVAKLEAFWRFFRPQPLPSLSSGPAPLTVAIVWPSYPVASPVKIEFDANGDGEPEWVEETYQVSAPRQYVYQRQGQYEFTVRIYDRAGQVLVYKSSVSVFTPADFDAELKARWRGLKEALRRGDISGALECMHTHSRDRYNEAFRAAVGTLSQKVDEILTDITAVRQIGGAAYYEAVRREGTLAKSFEVRFGIDVDGVWRVSGF
jgi:hypothetical protein